MKRNRGKNITKKLSEEVSTPLFDIAAYNRTETEKRPQEEAVGNLYLDPHNPRLADFPHTGTQASIQRVMEREFDLQPLMDSMYKNGFFWEEPLVAVREALAEKKNKECLVVVEGNRRLAALKNIWSNENIFPDDIARNRLKKIPVIVRDRREETLAFVGFRHITGIVPWESAAKAQYAHELVNKGLSLQQISQTIGDKTQDIGRWVRTQSLVDEAEGLGLLRQDASRSFYFSYLLTATDAPATKRWLEMKIAPKTGLVTSVNTDRLTDLWNWLYGSKQNEIQPIIPESRQIHKLNKIIASPRAVLELKKSGNLERALVETKERGEYIVESLGTIRSLLQDLHGNLAGQDTFATSLDSVTNIVEAQSEFGKITRALAQVKEALGF